jgi:hypothetical protein
MRLTGSSLIEHRPRFEADRDAALPAEIHDLLKPGTACPPGHKDPVEGACRPQRFPYGMNPDQHAHAFDGTQVPVFSRALSCRYV